jgi:hypothetical protein
VGDRQAFMIEVVDEPDIRLELRFDHWNRAVIALPLRGVFRA